MGKKKATIKKTNAQKANVLSSFVTLSSNPTTDLSALKRSIKRKQKQNSVSHLFDHSLPNNISFHGIIKPNNNNTKANVHGHDDITLSPFILELRQNPTTPEELLDDDGYQDIQLNFLNERLLETNCKENIQDDLTLSAHEASNQISDNGFQNAVERQKQEFAPIKKTTEFSIPLSITGTSSSFSIKEFEPKALPKNYETYFDLPETESEEEEMVEEENLVLLKQYLNQEEEEEQSAKWFPKFSFSISMPQGWHKTIGAFVAISFIFVLPIHAMNVFDQLRELKGESETIGKNAISALESGASATLDQNTSGALSSFSQAVSEFNKAENSIDNLGGTTSLLLASLPQTKKSYKTAESLVATGKSLSLAGERISEGLLAIEQNVNPTPASHLELLEVYLRAAYPHLVSANDSLKKVDLDVVPENQQEILKELKSKLPLLVSSSEEFLSLFETIKTIVGANGSKRYLLVFQNNTEIRPTGGFMGSFAELKMHDGLIEQLSIPGGGTYDLQGWLKDPLVAPGPLQLLKARWEFQDANWFPDFPSSARQILQFYKNAGGPDVDGVIAINATHVSELIGLLGPIDMPEYQRVIDEENFLFEAQKIVELEYDREENKPKAFIGDLAPKLIEKATAGTPELFLSILDKVNQGLSEKEIQIYFQDQETQRAVVQKGWAGKIKQTSGDYFMLVNTNLGGGKTDGVISENIDFDVNISSTGEITNTVTIKRTHNGMKGVVFTGRNNVNYVRLYVPRGSKLVSATGFSIPDDSLFESPSPTWSIDDDLRFAAETFHTDESSQTGIFEEEGKTVFGNWIQTKPGSTSTTTFTYKLPFTIDSLEADTSLSEKIKSYIGLAKTDKYTLTIQKQSGVMDRTTNVNVQAPDFAKTAWSSHNGTSASFKNKTDGYFAILLER